MLRQGRMVNDLNVKVGDRLSVVAAFVLPTSLLLTAGSGFALGLLRHLPR
jgi:hypothetical protein